MASLRTRFALGAVGACVMFCVVAPASPSAGQANSPRDFYLEAFGDPLDFSNPQDHVIADDMAFHMTAMSISEGQMHLDLAQPGYFSALWAGYPTGIPHGREGAANPIDTSTYKRIVFRMNASAAVPAMVRWFTCVESNDTCSGGYAFTTVLGWHTYDFTLATNTSDPSVRAPWTGRVVGLRVLLSPTSQTHVDVDWLRLVPSGDGPVDEITGGAPPPPSTPTRLDYATYAGNPWDTCDRCQPIQDAHG